LETVFIRAKVDSWLIVIGSLLSSCDPLRGGGVEEEWRDVPGYDGWYECSDLGRVRSWRSGSHQGRRDEPLVMSPGRRNKGYLHVGLTKAGRVKYLAISRMVLTAFVGEAPGRDWDACHDNGINTDNRLSNLRWDTKAANAADKRRHGTQFLGEEQPASKLTERAVKEARVLVEAGNGSIRGLARKHGVSKTTMWQAVRGKTWSHV
jgi:hypothetical protein